MLPLSPLSDVFPAVSIFLPSGDTLPSYSPDATFVLITLSDFCGKATPQSPHSPNPDIVDFIIFYSVLPYLTVRKTHGFIRNFFTDHIFVQFPTIYGILYSVDKAWTFVHIEKLPKIL